MSMIDPKTRKKVKNRENTLCYYGCRQIGQYFFHRKERWCCSQHESSCPAKRLQRSETAKRLWKTEEYRHVHHWNRNKDGWFYKLDEEIFCLNSAAKYNVIMRYAKLRKIIPYRCACGITDKWLDLPITLQLHHKNGNKKDSRKENLAFLCPNCHTQTNNYGYKGKKEILLEFAKREFEK